MTPEQIAADVSKRYSLPVMAGAVKQCPPSTFTWQLTGGDNAPTKPKDASQAFYRNRARKLRLANAIDETPRNDTDAEIARLYNLNHSVASIAIAVGVSRRSVGNHIKRMGIYDPEKSKAASRAAAAASNKARAKPK